MSEIDLDALEAKVNDPDNDRGFDYVTPDEVLALMRVVRTAEAFLRHVEHDACMGADGECSARCEDGVALREALEPFRAVVAS